MKKLFKEDKKKFYFISVTALLLLLAIASATYAWFVTVFGETKISNIDVGLGDLDRLVFDIDKPLSLIATPDKLQVNGDNYSVTSVAKTTLSVPEENDATTYNYDVLLNITDNSFEYISEQTPEIILSVSYQEGNGAVTPITAIDGLTYGTYSGVNDNVSGFDITAKTVEFFIKYKQTISANTGTDVIQKYIFTLTYLNKDYDQSANFGNSMTTEIVLQKHVSTLFAEKIIELASTNEHIYHHTSDTTASDYVANNAGDDSYRYAGPNSTVDDNYVCFGYNRESYNNECESGTFSATSVYAYRIIGVFKDVDGNSNDAYYVKLIKATSYGSYHWDNESSTSSNRSSDFDNSQLFSTTLNGTSSGYLATLNNNGWEDYIAQPKWYVGGNTWENIYQKKASVAYTNERTDTNTVNTIYKIGLMYPSDYGFATSNSYWTTALSSYNSAAAAQDWLYVSGLGVEWTISRTSDTTNGAFRVNSAGIVDNQSVWYSYVVRPVLYLSSNVKAIGSGTIESPYILSM